MCSYDDSEREFFVFIASIFGWKSSLFGKWEDFGIWFFWLAFLVDEKKTEREVQKKQNETKDTPKLAREQYTNADNVALMSKQNVKQTRLNESTVRARSWARVQTDYKTYRCGRSRKNTSYFSHFSF